MKTKFIFLVLFFIGAQSCIRIIPDDELTMARTPYTGKEIRLDGYYSGITYHLGETTFISYLFFYSNGVAFESAGYDSKINDILKIMEDERNDKNSWAVFQLENNIIHTQGWHNTGSGFFGDVQINSIIDNSYKIINDTTLFFEKSTWGNNMSNHNIYFYFKKFSTKPDSTNVFIK